MSLVLVLSYIIELSSKLIIFDTQFSLLSAKEILNYAKYLNKPINRVIISHAHPDHFSGAEVFKNLTKFHALS